MKTELLDEFFNKVKNPIIVTNDSIETNIDNIFILLNKVTSNNWSYTIDKLDHMDNGDVIVVTLFVPGRVTQGIASSKDVQMATKEALIMAYNSLKTEGDGNKNLLVGNNIPENKKITTIEEIEKEQNTSNIVINDNEKETNEKENIDESLLNDKDPVIKGSEVTEKQIYFMNKFKAHNKIKNDSQFDYFIKTWSENTGIDDIKTKTDLVFSNYQTIQNFIDWIKKMQPALDNGLASPIE